MTQTINSIEITSPARLHLGFIDLNGSQGRKFGSVGLTIDTFFTKIKVTHIERTKGQINSNCERSKQYAKQFCKVFSIESSFSIDGVFSWNSTDQVLFRKSKPFKDSKAP